MNNYKTVRKNGKRYQKHRIIMEEYLRRKLRQDEIIHHIDGNKQNNELSNLWVMSNSMHIKIHNIKNKKTSVMYLICEECGKEFEIRSNIYKKRIKQGSKHFYCSKHCASKNKNVKYENKITVLTCDYCGKKFERKTHTVVRSKRTGTKHFFCCERCNCMFHKRKRKYVALKCDCCGKIFMRKSSRVKRHNKDGAKHTFCCDACHGTYRELIKLYWA